MKGRLLVALLSVFLSETTSSAQLQVEVRVNVLRGCLLVPQARQAGTESAGLLDFGSAARLDDPHGPLDAQLLSSHFARLECNPDTAYQLQVDGGLNGGVGEVRYLAASDPAAKPIAYRLFRDSARQRPLSVDIPVSGVVPSSGSLNLPLYARIDRIAEVPRASSYFDTLHVTLSW